MLILTNTWNKVGMFVAQVVFPVTLKARKKLSMGEGTLLHTEVATKPYTPMLSTLRPLYKGSAGIFFVNETNIGLRDEVRWKQELQETDD